MIEEQMNEMAEAFLRWPLPDDVCADDIACKAGAPHRTGTNLLTAHQALAMIRFVCRPELTAMHADVERLSADLAALRAELESAHAAQRNAETELSQYMAWYAMAEQERGHQYRRAEKAEAERDGLRARIAALEDEKNAYIDYVGDALGQDHDSESLWDAAQRVLSDRDRIRVERDEVKALAVRWLRKWQTDMNPTPEMLEQTHALIGAALGER